MGCVIATVTNHVFIDEHILIYAAFSNAQKGSAVIYLHVFLVFFFLSVSLLYSSPLYLVDATRMDTLLGKS